MKLKVLSFLIAVAFVASARTQAAEFRMELLSPNGPISTGQQTALKFSLFSDASNKPLTGADLKVEHEKLLHFFLLDSAFAHYNHEHPEEVSPGVWQVIVASKSVGKIKGWVQFHPTSEAHTQTTSFQTLALDVTPALTATDDNYKVTLSFPEGEPFQHTMSTLKFLFEKDGKVFPAADLENYLGAKMHVAAVSADQSEFVHTHPGHEPAATAGSDDTLMLHFMETGYYAVFVQFVHLGKLHTVKFGFNVKAMQ